MPLALPTVIGLAGIGLLASTVSLGRPPSLAAEGARSPHPPPPTPGSMRDAGKSIPPMLSASLGLDNAMPPGSGLLCTPDPQPIAGLDGMPVVFSRRLDATSLDHDDFAVITKSGRVLFPMCVTLNPANDPGEERTVLLAGDLGDEDSDPALEVVIVGEVLTLDGVDLSLDMPSIPVTRLAAGPSLVWVERVDPEEVGAPPSTTVAIRACWSGGIVALDGDEVRPEDWGQYVLTVLGPDGPVEAAPFAVGDLDDQDNNHLLFFDVVGVPVRLSLPADVVIDPNHDPNPATASPVRP